MRAKPILTYGLVAGALALPVSAVALGLGKLTVESALRPAACGPHRIAPGVQGGTRFRSRPRSPTRRSIGRTTCNTRACSRAHARPLERDPNGDAYLKVTSPVTVNEPYLDLLVEVNWSAGRVVRDYTFLLDPPGSTRWPRSKPVAPPFAPRHAPARGQAAGTGGTAAPRGAAPPGGDTYRSSVATRCRRSQGSTSPRRSRSNRCWSRCSRATRTPSTART